MMTSEKSDINVNFTMKLSITKVFKLDTLICPLQIINWHWTPIMDPSCCKLTTYPSAYIVITILQVQFHGDPGAQAPLP